MARRARTVTPAQKTTEVTSSEAALEERLNKARASKAADLDLSKLNLGELPSDVFDLDHLTSLDLSGNKLTDLPDTLGRLKNLQVLQLNSNPLAKIPNAIFMLSGLLNLELQDTTISKIPAEISKLNNLERLEFSLSPIEIVTDEFYKLENLTELWFHFCKLSGFPDPILACRRIRTLVLGGNSLLQVPKTIGVLHELRFLALDRAGLSEIPDVFDHLFELTDLHLEENSISTLPPSIRSLSTLRNLHLEDNPLPIPPEILASDPKNILDFYFTHVASAAAKVPLNEAKMVVVGQGGVGKTSLVKRLVGQPYDPAEDTTRGIWISPWDVGQEQERLKINIWDFGGQEIMHATHQFFLTKRTLYALVLDSRQGEHESRLEYWLKIVQSFGAGSPIIIICNKADKSRLTLDETGLKSKYGSIVGFATTVSCETGEGIDALREMILQEIHKLDHLHDLFLPSWIVVKEELDSMRDKKYDYISFDEYQKICTRHTIADPTSQRTLIEFLHDLGVVLNFPDPTLEGTNILSPVWVTAGVYRILTWHLEGGILLYNQVSEILDPIRYPPRQHLFILGMMKKFELCFQFEDAPEPTYLIPDLLPKSEPDTGSWEDTLRFQYHYEVLPSSVISRFIVRMNHYISNRTYWRNGVVIAKDGNRALVKADLEDRKIFIYVSGPHPSRRRLMDIIRAEFERIHATIPRLTVEEKVPIPDQPSVVVDYSHLLDLFELGESSFVPEKSKQRYEVRALLEGIETAERRQERQEDILERRGFTARRRPVEPTADPPISIWRIGIFFLTALVLTIIVLGGTGYFVGGATLSLIMIGAVIILCLIGAFVALMAGKLSEKNTVALISNALARLSLLRTSERKGVAAR